MTTLYVSKTRESEPSVLSLKQDEGLFNFSLLHSTVTELSSENKVRGPRGHSHSVYHLILFLEGKNEILLQDRNVSVSRGSLVICSPGMIHDFSPGLPGRLQYAEVTFEYLSEGRPLSLPFRQVLSRISNRLIDIPDGVTALSEEQTRELLRAIQGYCTLQADPLSPTFDTHLRMAEIFRIICSYTESETYDLSVKIKNLIAAGLTEKLDLETLAGELNISKTYLVREFKKTWNTTPMEYHRYLRLSGAAGLLRSSEVSLREIASLFGFYDAYHFSKAFQKLYGLAPGEFRKRNRHL